LIVTKTDKTTKLLSARAKTHGDFGEDAALLRRIMEVMRTGRNWKDLTPEQEYALCMIAMKIARALTGDPNYRDHWDDIAGYARLVAERC
jgi:hypothetical protein